MNNENTLWLHKKSGGLYTFVCEAEIEADLTPAVVYKALEDGRVWIRPTAEFFDGRFVRLDQITF